MKLHAVHRHPSPMALDEHWTQRFKRPPAQSASCARAWLNKSVIDVDRVAKAEAE
jgi:hypothetical protein